MKWFLPIFLLSALATVQVVSAEDTPAQLRAKQAAAARRVQHSGVQAHTGFQGQQHFQNTPRLNQNPAMQRRYVQPLNTRGLVNQSQQHTPRITPYNGTVYSDAARNAAWRARTNQNWQNNGDPNHGNQNLRNTDSSTSTRDWQNRNGNYDRERFRGSAHLNWDRQRRTRSWWRSHYTRFAVFGGGYYYWNGGYWYPAYGYDPYFSTYSYDAPIYSYNDEDPGQVIANVQAALQQRGYDPGAVDGTYGPNTREALLNFQQDNGLQPTGQIDEATLNSLGMQ